MAGKNAEHGTEIIKLLVRPNSVKNNVDGLYKDRIKIRISSPPEKGKANKALIEFISEKTGIPKTYIKIISGEKSNFKEIAVKKHDGPGVFQLLLN